MSPQKLLAYLFIGLSAQLFSCSDEEVTVEVTIIKVADLRTPPLNGAYCAYDFEPGDTTLEPKNYNQFIADCGKHQVGDRVNISRSYFK